MSTRRVASGHKRGAACMDSRWCNHMHKVCANPRQAKSQDREGNWAWNPSPSQGAVDNSQALHREKERRAHLSLRV